MIYLLKTIVDFKVLVTFELCEVVIKQVIFKRDFGPWKKGQYCLSLALYETDNGVFLEEFNKFDIMIFSTEVQLDPKKV